MPAKYILKQYVEDGYYHIFNRGVEKRDIFVNESNYVIFLYFMKLYLTEKERLLYEIKHDRNLSVLEEDAKIKHIMPLQNFYGKIQMLSFVCMPNHFHFQIRQKGKKDMTSFMRCLMTKYTQYFNHIYSRVGPLFQGRYKAIHINREEYFLHINRYIHRNPLDTLPRNKKLKEYRWSSYPAYIKNLNILWLKKEPIITYFQKINGFGFSSYQGFVEGFDNEALKDDSYYRELLLE